MPFTELSFVVTDVLIAIVMSRVAAATNRCNVSSFGVVAYNYYALSYYISQLMLSDEEAECP